jgi:hypothetical protein
MSAKPSKQPPPPKAEPKPIVVNYDGPASGLGAVLEEAIKPKASVYPSVSTLGLDTEHFPTAIDLRPYHPHFADHGPTRAAAGAIAATFARTGKPLPFTPSPEHIAAVGGVDGVNKFGVRAHGVKMGEPPTEYDLSADAMPISIQVYDLDGVDPRAAFAAGYVVRVGDAFLVAYRPDELHETIFVLSNGQEFSIIDLDLESLKRLGAMHVWKVERV